MGAGSSKQRDFLSCGNDYEIVVKSSKELEYLLEQDFDAEGTGLHEKISSARGLTPSLVKDMRFLATIRNKLIHERGFDSIPNRKAFIQTFECSAEELEQIVVRRRVGSGSQSSCVIS
jgi:hypothetical protein